MIPALHSPENSCYIDLTWIYIAKYMQKITSNNVIYIQSDIAEHHTVASNLPLVAKKPYGKKKRKIMQKCVFKVIINTIIP